MKKLREKIDFDLFKDFALTFLSFIIVGFSGLLIYYLIPRFLSSNASEIFAVFKKTSALLLVAFILGMGVTVPKFVLETERSKAASILIKGVFLSLVVSLISLAVIISFPEYWGDKLIGREFQVIDIICIFSIIISGVFSGIIYSYFRGIYIIKEANLLVVINAISQILLVMLVKTIYQYIVLSSVVVFLISILFLLFKSSFIQELRACRKSDFFSIKKQFVYGALRVPGDFSLEGLSSLPVIYTTTSFGISMGGQMAYALTIFGLVLSVMSPINFIMLPKVSKALKVDGDFLDAKRIVSQSALIVVPIIALSSISIFYMADFIAEYIFSSSSPEVLVEYIRHICIAVIPFAIYTLLRSVIDAWYSFPLNSLNCFVAILVFIGGKMLFSDFDLGILYAMILAYTVLGFLTIVGYFRIFKRNQKNE